MFVLFTSPLCFSCFCPLFCVFMPFQSPHSDFSYGNERYDDSSSHGTPERTTRRQRRHKKEKTKRTPSPSPSRSSSGKYSVLIGRKIKFLFQKNQNRRLKGGTESEKRHGSAQKLRALLKKALEPNAEVRSILIGQKIPFFTKDIFGPIRMRNLNPCLQAEAKTIQMCPN